MVVDSQINWDYFHFHLMIVHALGDSAKPFLQQGWGSWPYRGFFYSRLLKQE